MDIKSAELVKEEIGRDGIFGITFIKKDGTTRHMSARLGVKSHLRGGDKSYSDEEKNIITVFDMNKKSYRGVRLDSVVEIAKGGKVLYSKKIPQ